MLLLVADRALYRNPQLVKMQRMADHGVPIPINPSTTQLPQPGLRGHPGNGVERLQKPEDQEACWETVSSTNKSYTHDTSAI